MKAKKEEQKKELPAPNAFDETDIIGTIIAVVLGIIFIAWIIVITPAIIHTVFWKP